MESWQPTAYKQYQWIVADPQLLGGKLAIRGTRLGVSLILECLASGMSLDDIDESFGGTDAYFQIRHRVRIATMHYHTRLMEGFEKVVDI